MTPSLIDSFQTMSIRKGDTYHPNNNTTSKSDFWDPLESRVSSPPMPVRSATSPKSLEDLLMGAGERRVAHLLNRVDKAINAKSRVALAHVLSDPDVLPSPNVQQTKTRTRHHSHSSDSGIGSSVADSTESAADKLSTRSGEYNRPAPPHSYANRMQPVARSEPSPAVDQSFYSISAADEERGLSKYAADQIHRYIIRPILREDSLAEFHDLIQSVPSRIGNKEIKNLRDLEKTLIFLAPVSPHALVKFTRAFTHDVSAQRNIRFLLPSTFISANERSASSIQPSRLFTSLTSERPPTDRTRKAISSIWWSRLVCSVWTPEGAIMVNRLL